MRWADFDNLIAIYYEAYEERARGEPIGIVLFRDRPSRPDEVTWFAGLYRRALAEEAFVVVAEEGGSVLGSCTVGPVGSLRQSETGHIGELGILVARGHRGRGIGSALIRQALDLSRGRFEQVRLAVFADNEAAQRLYARFGFVPCGRIPRAVKRGPRYVDELLMILDLTAPAAPPPPAKG